MGLLASAEMPTNSVATEPAPTPSCFTAGDPGAGEGLVPSLGAVDGEQLRSDMVMKAGHRVVGFRCRNAIDLNRHYFFAACLATASVFSSLGMFITLYCVLVTNALPRTPA